MWRDERWKPTVAPNKGEDKSWNNNLNVVILLYNHLFDRNSKKKVAHLAHPLLCVSLQQQMRWEVNKQESDLFLHWSSAVHQLSIRTKQRGKKKPFWNLKPEDVRFALCPLKWYTSQSRGGQRRCLVIFSTSSRSLALWKGQGLRSTRWKLTQDLQTSADAANTQKQQQSVFKCSLYPFLSVDLDFNAHF